MQLTGKKCYFCNKNISFQIDGEGCHFCDIAFHKKCLDGSKICPSCHRSFFEIIEDEVYNLSKTEKIVLQNKAGNSIVIGILMFIIAGGLTAASFFSANERGGSFIVFHGAILVGLLYFLRGLKTWLKCRDLNTTIPKSQFIE